MPWFALAGAAIQAAPALIGGSKGAQGPRNISFENVNSDPWAVDAYGRTADAQTQQQNFANATAGQNGLQNQSNVFGQQQQLANQLTQQSMGQGPNPAQAQLANNTANNVQQQSALMGSQRGTSQNAGLLARQAAMQGSAIQQQGVGQAAALQAQQQIAAQQALMQQQASMGGLATNQVGQQANALNAAQTGAQNLFGTQSQNIANWNSGQITAATGASSNAAAYDLQQNKQNNAMLGGALQGAGSAMQLFNSPSAPAGGTMNSSGNNNLGYQNDFSKLANGGSVSQGGPCSSFGMRLKGGGSVPGQASMPTKNSPQNDTVHAMLSPGETVIDLETLKKNDKIGKAARMVTAYINQRNRK